MESTDGGSLLPARHHRGVGGCVTGQFRPTGHVPPQRAGRALSERQRKILAILSTCQEGLALRAIRASLSGSPAEWEVKDDLALLKQLELVQTRGHGRGAYWSLVRK